MNTFSVLLLFLLFILPLRIITSSSLSKDAQVEALLTWKKSLLSSSTILHSWSISNRENLCKNWKGISCNSDGHVSELNVSGAGLAGTLERFNFTSFPKLITFNLTSNLLNGSIPSEIGKLIELQVLGLENNQITGIIPYQISNLKKLWMIYLRNNKLQTPDWSKFRSMPSLTKFDLSSNLHTGELPDFILKCHNLLYLDLSFNNFSGSIPKSLFTDLAKLEAVHLQHNSFDRILSSNFSKLLKPLRIEEIYLNNNLIQGEIPSFIGECMNVRWLDLSYNSLTGNIPFSFSNLTMLYELDLSHNFLSGEILPQLFSNWININSLFLSNNRFTGRIPSSVGVLTSVVRLFLENNRFSGSIPPEFGNCNELNHLRLNNNSLSGNIPSSFCNASNLLTIDLSMNKLSGIIPRCLGTRDQLCALNFGKNYLHGTIPEIFAKANRWQYLILNENQLEGPLPRSLVNCHMLEIFDVGNNLINDVFPKWVETLPQLQVLVLRSNNFHGSLGSSMTKSPFSNLKIFDIANNNFTGLLPTVYFQHFKAMINVAEEALNSTTAQNQYYDYSIKIFLKGGEFSAAPVLRIFVSIDLSYNIFQGIINSSIGALKSLKCLNVSHNNLTGHIPSSLRNLTNLETLDLSSNKLVGRIPSELVQMTFLEVLNLSYNNLDGPIPHGGQFPFENNSYIGNTALCGSPLTKSCVYHGEAQELPTLPREDDDDSSNLFRDAALVGYGCGTLIGLGIGFLLQSYGKMKWIGRISKRKHWRRPIRAL